MEGDFKAYCDQYDFSSFTYQNPLEMMDEHRLTPYFPARFGGGLSERPVAHPPPCDPADDESRYLHHLFEAYGDKKKATLAKVNDLGPWPELANHYHRQRESFYPDVLSRLYFQLADRIVEGGLFLSADHLLFDAIAQPALRELARQDDEFNQQKAFGSGTDTWEEWWAAAESRVEYTEAVKRRAAIWDDKGRTKKVTLGYHLETLRCAGFQQVGTIWQYLDDYVVCAAR